MPKTTIIIHNVGEEWGFSPMHVKQPQWLATEIGNLYNDARKGNDRWPIPTRGSAGGMLSM